METGTILKNNDLKSLSIHELESIMSTINEPSYRAKQVFKAMHKYGIEQIEDIHNIKKETRQILSSISHMTALKQTLVKISSDQTRKYQFETHDGHIIESVFIPHAAKIGRHSLCISSQVGCAMGCKFCATASLKLKRNLTSSEIITQVYLVIKDILAHGDKTTLMIKSNERPIHNIVFMGMGEPLHNFDNLIKAINLLTHEDGLSFSPRRITVSTSGLVPKIKELGEKTNVYLAISLNATTNITRNEIMPVNHKWPIEELIKAAHHFPLKLRERITFEYVMLKGINDTEDDAMRLAKLMHGLYCKVNLIPFNEHPLSPFKKPDHNTILAFHNILYKQHISVFTRKTRGDDIDAACGMLGAKKLENARKCTS